MDDWGIGIRFLSGAEIFNFFDIEIIFRVHSSSYPMSTGGFIPDIKQQGLEANWSPPASSHLYRLRGVTTHALRRCHGVVFNKHKDKNIHSISAALLRTHGWCACMTRNPVCRKWLAGRCPLEVAALRMSQVFVNQGLALRENPHLVWLWQIE